MPFPVDAEIVCDAMVAADAYGRAFREAQPGSAYGRAFREAQPGSARTD